LLNLINFEKDIDQINNCILNTNEKCIIHLFMEQFDKEMSNADAKKKRSVDFQLTVNTLYEKLRTVVIDTELNNIYSSIVKINNHNNNIISYINTNFSLKYLEKYKEYINTSNNTIKISDFAFNRFYPNTSKFPETLSLYLQKYFEGGKFTKEQIQITKQELLKKYYDYDYNELYFVNSTFDIYIVEDEIINDPLNLIIKKPARPFSLTEIISSDFNCGYYSKILYKEQILNTGTDKTSIFSDHKPFNIKNNKTKSMNWLKTNDDFNIKENIPIISLEYSKQIIQIIGCKIMELVNSKFITIINTVESEISKKDISKKFLNNIKNTLIYLKSNETLLKKIMIDKFVIFLISYIKTIINNEISYLIQNIFIKDILTKLTPSIATTYKESPKDLIANISKYYKVQMSNYTINTMIPKILLTSTSSFFKDIEEAVIELNVDNYVKSGEKKLLLNKCVVSNRIDILKDTLLNKINLRTLDRNGNTILNRLIDQYNDYAIQKVLELDNELYTYMNNRGQTSIDYLFDVLDSINDNYSLHSLNKRLHSYETDLQVWIKSDGSFGDIELDESKHMIFNIILNSLYLFNEFLWLHLLKAPNGWKFEDKKKLKEIIKKYLNYDIEENILIKSLTPEDMEIMKNNSNLNVFNNKINDAIHELNSEVNELENTNKQLEEEKTNEFGKNGIDTLIIKNTNTINAKKQEIENLERIRISNIPNDNLNRIFENINNTELINQLNMDWEKYNNLIVGKDETSGKLLDNIIWNYYLPIINIVNNKNMNMSKKYISYYNYSLLNLDYRKNKLDEDEINVLINYYTKIINNVYSDFYDLEKYEDSEFNYINDAILNIIYINLVNVIKIEMFSAIIGYISSKYTDNDIVKNYKDSKISVLLDIIDKLLKTAIWDKLDIKNKDYPQNYVNLSIYENEIKSDVKTIFGLLDSDEDIINLNNIIKFYKGLVENVSFNIYNEILNFLNDMKKNSLLFGILNIINTFKNKK
jgi:hypothetical protein